MVADFILFGGTFLSFIFTLHLFTYNVGNILLNRLLGLLFLVRALNSSILVVNSVDFFDNQANVIALIQGFLFLAPATLFLYIRAFLFDETRLKKKDVFHLVPFGLMLVIFSMFFVNYRPLPPDQLRFEQQRLLVFMVLKSLLFLSYIYFCWRMLFIMLKDDAQNVRRSSIKWLYLLLTLTSLSHLFQLFTSSFSLLNIIETPNQFNSTRFLVISGLASTFFIIFILRNPNVLYGNLVPRLRTEHDNTFADLPQRPGRQSDSAFPSGDLLEIGQIEGYLQMIENHMKEALPFLDPSFSIGQLSEKLEIPVHHCSFVLNQGLGKNFREYINKYRVEYFIKEYPTRISNQTLESIANISGFKSSSTFYSSFKKETGTSPTSYFS